MKAKYLARILLIAIATGTTTATYADPKGENLVYIGYGAAKNAGPYESAANPVSLGYLQISNTNATVWGVDISGEGTKLDSTWGQYEAVKQGISYNFLVGTNLARSESGRFDAAILVGAREKTTSCPSSYLGYQCYADEEPDNGYSFNYGAVLAWSFNSFTLGVRATGESTQALFGYRF